MNTALSTGTDELLARVEDGVAIVTMNRPEFRNALSDDMYRAFGQLLPTLAVDDSVRVVLLTGSGASFSAGGDVKAMYEAHRSGRPRPGRPEGLDDQVEVVRNFERMVVLGLHQLPKPVIAAINGPAAGAGFSISLAADIRLAAESSTLVPAFSNLATSGDFGVSWSLARLVGPSRAKDLLWRSQVLSARQAEDVGIVDHVMADDGFDRAATAWCADLAIRPPTALRLAKENVNFAVEAGLSAVLDLEAKNMVRSMNTADHREAVAAFVERRDPSFRGA